MPSSQTAGAVMQIDQSAVSAQDAQQPLSQNATVTAQHTTLAVLKMASGGQLPSAQGGQSSYNNLRAQSAL